LWASDVLLVVRPQGQLDRAVEAVRSRLTHLYGGVLPGAEVFARPDRSRTHVVAGLMQRPVPDTSGRTAWGLPVGAAGEATAEELAAVAGDPGAGRSLLGTWVLLEETQDGVLLVSGADLVHTLVRASGPDGVAYATRGLAALTAVGAPLRIALDRVPEYIAFDYVLGDDELLEGTEVLHEAAVVRSDARGDRVSTYWPVEERLAPGAPTDARRLREVVTADVVRMAAVPGAHVALTAGRDSALVASCLRDAGVVVPTLTMGHDAYPDVIGARAVAAAWGTDHRLLAPGPATAPSLARAVCRSAWTEGLETAWNLVGGGMRWDGPADVTWIGGNGGEIGRATYGNGRAHPSPDHGVLVRTMLRESDPAHWRKARPALERRMGQALEEARVPGREGWDPVDVVYARGWMRKWLLRSLPRPEVRGMLTGYTSPEVVRALLDIPLDARVRKTVFDEALDLTGLNLHRVAQQALPARPTGHPPAPVSPLRRLVPPQAGRALRAVRPPVAPGPLGQVLAQLPADLVCHEAMGRAWWRETVHLATRSRRDAHLLWNAVAVEALAQWLAQRPGQGVAPSTARSSETALA
jgi:hypothetical protein